MKKLILCAVATAGLALATQSQAAGGVKAGTLSCHVASGWGLIFGSSRDLACTFTSPNGHIVENYKGTIKKFGVDVGYQQSGVIVWTVLAPVAELKPGQLAGKFAGGTAGASVGVGLGANALIGGSGDSITLQPLSIQGTTGLNVAAGIGAITLEAAGTAAQAASSTPQ